MLIHRVWDEEQVLQPNLPQSNFLILTQRCAAEMSAEMQKAACLVALALVISSTISSGPGVSKRSGTEIRLLIRTPCVASCKGLTSPLGLQIAPKAATSTSWNSCRAAGSVVAIMRPSASSCLNYVKADVHKDLGNADTPSLLIGVSTFNNGELWVESPDGKVEMTLKDKVICGNLYPVCDTKVFFDARNTWHATMPWHGDRLVLAAYNPAFMDNLQPTQLEQLRQLGFQLSSDAASASASSPLPTGLGGSGGASASADQGVQGRPC